MLIKFQSAAAAPFSMLVEHAKPLLRGMGQGDKNEGSISAENLISALEQLEAALAAAQVPVEAAATSDDEDCDEEPPVEASVRAAPLVNMLHKAKDEDTYVMWQPE